MSVQLDQIVNTNTFGVWKDRTNEIVTALEDVVTIGGPTANRAGDITIQGDITSTATVHVNNIMPYDVGTGLLTLGGAVTTDGELTVSNGGSGQTKITLVDDGAITWKLHTTTSHNQFDIGRAEKYLRLDYSTGAIEGSGFTISGGLLPSSDAVQEGIVNLYYDDDRVRAAIGVESGSSITYNQTTGLFDFVLPDIPSYGVKASSALSRTQVPNSIDYEFAVLFDDDTIKTNSSGKLYVPDGAIVGAMSGGTGVSVAANGQISIAQSVATTADVEFESVSANTASLDTSVAIGSWTFAVDSSGNLEFSYGGTVVASISTAGKITAKNDVTAFGTP